MQTRILRWRRKLRKSQRQAQDISSQAEAQIDQHLFKRFSRLNPVRRFVLSWIGLVLLLIISVIVESFYLSGYYQKLGFSPGGIYSEGLQGSFTNANPIYASSDADQTLSHLIFAGLLKTGSDGTLVNDLASDYSVDSRGLIYTIHLKPHLTWQDGQPLTSEDVAYTYNMIENPDAGSPLFSSWQGVQVSTPDSRTIVLKLPDVLASFGINLTTGILPEHLLKNIPASDLRSADFNTDHPVGAGPFAWKDIQVTNGSDPTSEQVQVALKPFSNYALGAPKLDEFVVNVFADEQQLVNDFKGGQLTAMVATNPPGKQVENLAGVVNYNLLLRAATMVFFKTSTGILADSSVRQALTQAVNVPSIINSLGYPTHEVNEPILKGQLGYNPAYAQNPYDVSAANQKLDSDGWTKGAKGMRSKSGQPLSFRIIAADTQENHLVMSQLEHYWQAIGVSLNVEFLQPTDFQTALSYHDYDAVLTSISIGVDPDVFVYWDSSQADIRSNNRLNLSEYKNPTADNALESGRTRINPEIRIIKYAPFLQAWQQDNPALGLYQPRLLYLTHTPVDGLSDQAISSPVDRLSNVNNWQIHIAKVPLSSHS